MAMLPVVPTAPAEGVPVNAPVVVLKLAQAGCPVIEKVTVPVLADTVGRKEYALPAVTLAAGVPAMLSAVAGGVGGGVVGCVGVVVPVGLELLGELAVT